MAAAVSFMKKMMTILAFILVLCGCVSTLTREELKELTWKQVGYTVAEWRYMGSKKGYHYFDCTGIVLFEGGVYKIPSSELKVYESFPFTKDQSQWVLLPWGSPHPDNFHLARPIAENLVSLEESNGIKFVTPDQK